MPNYITNRLIIKADNQVVKKVLEFLKGEPNENGSPTYIDFNKIVPMPDALNIEHGNLGEIGMEYILASSDRYGFSGRKYEDSKRRFLNMNEERKKETLELGKMYLLNIVFFGYPTWYDWRIENWGTKWNASDLKFENGNEVWFTTANSSVEGLMIKLSEKFPDIEFEYTYADEDIGRNTGTGIIKNGISHVVSPRDWSNEGYELAFEMWPEYKNNYQLTDEGYKYKGED